MIREKDLPSSCPDSIDLGKANEPNHVELGRKDDARVHKMFLDHTGKWWWRSEMEGGGGAEVSHCLGDGI